MRRRTVLQGMVAAASASLVPSAWGETKPGRWLKLESPNFILHTTQWEDRSRSELVSLERFHALLLRLMPRDVQVSPKLEVYTVGSNEDFAIAEPANPPGVGGFYEAGLEQIRAVSLLVTANQYRGREGSRTVRSQASSNRALDSRVILFHEYTHHFTRTNARVIYPPWYREGLAEFLSTVEFTDNDCTLGKIPEERVDWLLYGAWMPIELFLTTSPLELSTDSMLQYYAQAWLAAHYLFSEPKRATGFNRYCVALQNGGDPITAFEPSFGVTPETLNQELLDYKTKPINQLRLSASAADRQVAITTTRPDSACDQIMMPLSHLRNLPAADVAAPSLAIIRNEAKKFPNHPFAIRALAWAEVWYGDLAVARTMLDALLQSDPSNPETLHLSGLCDLRRGYAADDAEIIKKARKAFAQAHKIDQTRSVSLYRYVECLYREANEVTPHMVDVLVTAFNQSPQVDVVAFVTAQALMQHDRFDEAASILQPMVGEVHSDGRAQVAAQLLQAAKAKEVMGFAFFGSAEDVRDGG